MYFTKIQMQNENWQVTAWWHLVWLNRVLKMYCQYVSYGELRMRASCKPMHVIHRLIKTCSTLNFPLPKIGVPIYRVLTPFRPTIHTAHTLTALMPVMCVQMMSAQYMMESMRIRLWKVHYLSTENSASQYLLNQWRINKKQNKKEENSHAENLSAFYALFCTCIFTLSLFLVHGNLFSSPSSFFFLFLFPLPMHQFSWCPI